MILGKDGTKRTDDGENFINQILADSQRLQGFP